MLKEFIEDSINVKKALLGDKNFIETLQVAINLLNNCFKDGNKILIAGNGGSAADSQHFAAEIVCKFKRERRAYPALALTDNCSIITAWSNDYDFKSVFSRQIEALGKPGDIFIGISTSGNSENITSGVNKAKEMGLKTICLLGRDGGKLKNSADINLIVPSDNTPRVQEVHNMLIHIICEEVEKSFSE
jgi:D-sedoheptulose 7-phosphate isomerase